MVTTLNIFMEISQAFIEGGPLGMSILTIILLSMLLAAWKAPNWVKKPGIVALVIGIIWTMQELRMVFDDVLFEYCDSTSVRGLMCGGFKCAIIPTMYGMIIYFISLIIRIIQKPRI